MKKSNHNLLLILCCIAVLVFSTSCQSSNSAATTVAFTSTPVDTPLPVQPAAPTETFGPKLTPTAVATGTPAPDQARAAILQALQALNTQPNRMDSTSDLGNGQVHKTVIEFIPPDRKHIISPDDGVEYIVIGEKVYAFTPSSRAWAQTQILASTFMGDQSEAALAKTVSNEQFVRLDTLDGRSVMIYSYLSTTQSSGVELHSQTELWVGQADGLPYKMVIDGEILSASVDPTTGESKLEAAKALTTTLIHFDPALRIEAPIP